MIIPQKLNLFQMKRVGEGYPDYAPEEKIGEIFKVLD